MLLLLLLLHQVFNPHFSSPILLSCSKNNQKKRMSVILQVTTQKTKIINNIYKSALNKVLYSHKVIKTKIIKLDRQLRLFFVPPPPLPSHWGSLRVSQLPLQPVRRHQFSVEARRAWKWEVCYKLPLGLAYIDDQYAISLCFLSMCHVALQATDVPRLMLHAS